MMDRWYEVRRSGCKPSLLTFWECKLVEMPHGSWTRQVLVLQLPVKAVKAGIKSMKKVTNGVTLASLKLCQLRSNSKLVISKAAHTVVELVDEVGSSHNITKEVMRVLGD